MLVVARLHSVEWMDDNERPISIESGKKQSPPNTNINPAFTWRD
jgi:hypothetical protein